MLVIPIQLQNSLTYLCREYMVCIIMCCAQILYCTGMHGIGIPELRCTDTYVKWVHLSPVVNGQNHNGSCKNSPRSPTYISEL